MQKYSTYKPSNVEWLGDVPSHWKVTRLINRTVRIVGGDWGDDPDLESDEHVLLPVIRVQDIDNEYEIGVQKLTYRNIKASKIDHRLIDSKTLLIEKSGGGEKQLVGRVAIPKKITMPAICSNFMEKIEMDEQAVPSFFNYVFHALYNQNMNFPFVQQTTGIQNLKSTYYFYTKVTYPNPTEQTAIAAYLDKATANIDEVIATKKKQLEKLEQYKQSKIHECVTKGLNPDVTLKSSGIDWLGDVPSHWKVWRLKDEAEYILTGSTPSTTVSEYYDNGTIKWFAPGSFNSEISLSDAQKFINKKALDDNELKLFPKGCLFLIGIGATIGKVAMIEEDSSCNQQLNVIKPTIKLESRYLTYFMKIYEDIIPRISQFTTLPIFNQTKTGQLNICIPPKNEQNDIANYLDNVFLNIKKEKSIINQQIEKLKQYRKCLIHECVTGKRKVISE